MLAFATLLCLAVSASAQVDCDQCTGAMNALVGALTDPTVIESQIAVLTAQVCPSLPEPVGCEKALKLYWSDIAMAMYPEFLNGAKVCGDLGLCSMLREWTCEECTGGLEVVAGVFKDPATIDAVVAFLNGEAYCGKTADAATCSKVCNYSIYYTSWSSHPELIIMKDMAVLCKFFL